LLKVIHKAGIELMAKKKEIRIIKNPKDLEPTFVGNRPADLVENYLNLQQNNSSSNNSNDTEKLVRKARHDSNRLYKNNLKNKSKPVTSKQNHSPVYE
jgi:hypothetical protein